MRHDDDEVVEYKGRIFDGVVTIQAWAIAKRLEPDPNISKDILQGLAIAAQIGLNHAKEPTSREKAMREKLHRIQEILDQ